MSIDKKDTPRKSYFGITSAIVALVAVLGLAASFAITMMNITPATFFKWNNITNLVYCGLSPIAVVLSLVGILKKNDSRILSGISIAIVGIPLIILLWNFANAF